MGTLQIQGIFQGVGHFSSKAVCGCVYVVNYVQSVCCVCVWHVHVVVYNRMWVCLDMSVLLNMSMCLCGFALGSWVYG